MVQILVLLFAQFSSIDYLWKIRLCMPEPHSRVNFCKFRCAGHVTALDALLNWIARIFWHHKWCYSYVKKEAFWLKRREPDSLALRGRPWPEKNSASTPPGGRSLAAFSRASCSIGMLKFSIESFSLTSPLRLCPLVSGKPPMRLVANTTCHDLLTSEHRKTYICILPGHWLDIILQHKSWSKTDWKGKIGISKITKGPS